MNKFASALVAVALVACGTSQQNVPANTTPSDSSGASDGSRADEHDGFMRGCMQDDGMAQYCECGWKVFATNVSREEAKAGVDKDREDELAKRILTSCRDKVSATTVHNNFVRGCTRHAGPSSNNYCECMFTELRKRYTPQDFADDRTAESPAFVNATNAIAAGACRSTIPEDLVQQKFAEGCMQGDNAKEEFCMCAWKDMRQVFTPAQLTRPEIVRDPAFKSEQSRIATNCGKYRPIASGRL